jgi:hypothetical protein
MRTVTARSGIKISLTLIQRVKPGSDDVVTFLASLVPVLLTIYVARGRRAHCAWTFKKANRQVWISILIIVVVIFIPAVPLSPLALILLVMEVFAVYRLTLALCRKKDLAKIPASAPSVS